MLSKKVWIPIGITFIVIAVAFTLVGIFWGQHIASKESAKVYDPTKPNEFYKVTLSKDEKLRLYDDLYGAERRAFIAELKKAEARSEQLESSREQKPVRPEADAHDECR